MAQIVAYEPWMQEGIVAVVRGVYDEYGFTWESFAYHRDLYDIAGYYLAPGGMFWTLVEDRRVIGCVGVTPHGEYSEVHRLYLDRAARGRGLGRQLLETAIEWSRAHGCRGVVAWSDVKLGLAHRLYLGCGFRLVGQRRIDDLDQSVEHGFVRTLE
jgi:putative acetyltransferase